MAETKSSQSLGNAAEAEEKALKKGGGGWRIQRIRPTTATTTSSRSRFTYNPDPGDPEETVAFGKLVKKGEAVEFTDPNAIRKLRGNTAFMDDAAKKKTGRGPRGCGRRRGEGAGRRHRAGPDRGDGRSRQGRSTPAFPRFRRPAASRWRKSASSCEQLVMRENETAGRSRRREGGRSRRAGRRDE